MKKKKKFCWLQQLSSSHRKKRGAETKERTRELWSYLIRSTVWKKKTETFSTLIWIWLSTTNAQKGRREVQVVRNVLWIKMYGKLLQRASWYKRHREREREETKSLKMMCTFLTAGLLVFCPPLHVSVVVCVCITDHFISAFLTAWSSQLEADWVKMNSTGGRKEGKLEKRWKRDERTMEYNLNKRAAEENLERGN